MSIARPIRPFLFWSLPLLAALPLAAQSTVHTGRLAAPGSADAKARQEFPFHVAAGQQIEVRLTSTDFYTYLELVPPEGDAFYKAPLTNDDYGTGTDSRVTAIASGSGTWRAVVGSYDDGQGAFSLEVGLGEAGKVQHIAQRALSEADSVSIKGRRYAIHSVDVGRETELLFEMISDGFQPMLIVESPTGTRYTSGEEGSEDTTTRIEIGSAEPGPWRVLATHAATEEPATGSYAVRMVEVPSPRSDAITGALEEADPRDIEGEHYDVHRIEGSATARLELELISSDFDAFLAARSPTGAWYRDDDGAGDQNARLELPAVAGTWLVIVTSFSAGETGRYRLTVAR
jgi:hypothetical protein